MAETEVWTDLGDQRVVRNVVRPTLEAVLPDPAKATGAAVIVAPGGGFAMLAMDNEGWPVARWLADHGIAAFVLKYRLNQTPPKEADFLVEVGKIFAAAAKGETRPAIREDRATTDMLAALQTVRHNAAGWKIDPNRVGAIGFSAGAMTTMQTVMTAPEKAGPAFFGYIYGPMLPVTVPAKAPPMFAALAIDDGLFGKQGFGIVDAWRKAGRPVELHAYERGDHGFGMGRAGTTTMLMMDEFRLWLDSRGLLAPPR
ncbi:alpha/beta hydrolase [Sphingomonas sp. CFBP 13706]|uniref:alpha/beta hydrolase n=1 Tax=Sphingomonas sp. CFBP 13706 TaxID=2775314 RepID=UPI0031453F0D